jgi:DNA polymerase III alpha subunit
MNSYDMRTNYNRQMILDETDLISSWLSRSDVRGAIFEDNSIINIYNEWCEQYDNEHTIQTLDEDSSEDYPEKCLQNWHMPEEYKTLDIVSWLENKQLAPEQLERTRMELSMFQERGMIPVLRFLVYLVGICKENKIVLGVGRGSSVASYVLYLIGIHKVDSIKYDLDIKEFLK